MSGFLDEVTIEVEAGRGGRGAVSFRREKYVPNGGPDGGDGGRGGSIVLVADSTDTTLSAFRERRRFRAGNGGDGSGKRSHGADADDLLLSVPPGTVVRDADSGELIADLDQRGARVVAAAGGGGGRGNSRFATSTRQAPRIGELGRKGEHSRLALELKLIADIGLVGLPNAGKSTLLARLTGAHPKIAAYPFTTLHPNLGVAETPSGQTLILADVPGLIEGAHRGVGLGIDFLRHLERTRVLLHLVDISAGPEAARAARHEVEEELRAFSAELADKPAIPVASKTDLCTGDEVRRMLEEWPDALAMSAATGDGCAELLERADELISDIRRRDLEAVPVAPAGEHRVYRYRPRGHDQPVITRDGDAYRVIHRPSERLLEVTDVASEEALMRLQRLLRRAGVDQALADAGCIEGDTVLLGDLEFVYTETGMS